MRFANVSNSQEAVVVGLIMLARAARYRGRLAGYQSWLVANMAQTTLPMGPGSVQPHSSHSESTT